jgi:Fe-S oxidoreductase/nitrate reductase gamma subunit
MADPKRSFKASYALGVLGVVSFLGVMGSFLLAFAPWIFHEVGVGRELFQNIPEPVVFGFYFTMAAFMGLTFYLFAQRAHVWQQGSPEDRTGRPKERVRRLRQGLSMQTLMEDPSAGIMHVFIYYGFVVLFIGTVLLEIDHLLPEAIRFLKGGFYQAYSAVLDIAGVVYLVGLGAAYYRRYILKPWRLKSKTKPEDGLILALLTLIGVSGLLTEAARIQLSGRPPFESWSLVGYPLSNLIPEASAAGWHQFFWVSHALAFLVFLVVLPTTKLRHMVMSPANMFLAPSDRVKGAMKPFPNLMEADVESVGASIVAEMSWKQIFDTESCTVCGRCTDVCPANATGKALDPREIVLKVGEVAAVAVGVSTPVTLSKGISITSDNFFERITSDELFACTTCGACDAACPVDIDILDKILDMRRYKTMMESEFPPELGKAFVATENQSNPWAMNQAERAKWTEALDFKVPILGEDTMQAEYLYWVGCAGSFDDRNVAVSRAVAKLLNHAGVDFAILGKSELCTGDSARRAGNEYLFQMMAAQNIETLNDLGVKRIIAQCPHCFTTLGNDYKQFGGDYEVVHHSQLLADLVRQGHIVPQKRDVEITFHDPCYLGRHNDVYIDPREVVAGTGDLVEMERSGTESFCCGAGGARFFMEEQTGKKVNIERSEEAIATGAQEIATACPFCYVMMDDGVKELGKEDIVVRDIAMVLADSAGLL